MCLEIYQLGPGNNFPAPGLAWKEALKKTEVNLELPADIDMLLMIEKGVRGGISHSINRYATGNNKQTKDYDKNEESLYLKYWDLNNLDDWGMSQKLPVNDFELVEDIFEFHESFIESCNGESDD